MPVLHHVRKGICQSVKGGGDVMSEVKPTTSQSHLKLEWVSSGRTVYRLVCVNKGKKCEECKHGNNKYNKCRDL